MDDKELDRLRWEGRIEERVEGINRHKADKTDLSALLTRASEMDSLVEKRANDRITASAEEGRRERAVLKEDLRANGELAASIGKELHQFRVEQRNRDQDKQDKLNKIDRRLELMASKRINWSEWIRWGLVVLAIIGATLTQDYRALLTFLR